MPVCFRPGSAQLLGFARRLFRLFLLSLLMSLPGLVPALRAPGALLTSIPPRASKHPGMAWLQHEVGLGVVRVCVCRECLLFSQMIGLVELERRGPSTREVVFLLFRSPGSMAGLEADGKVCAAKACAPAQGNET